MVPPRDSLSASVQVVAQNLPPALVSPDRLGRILDVAELLPPVAVAGFECRLAGSDPQVDLAIFLPSTERTFSVFAGLNPSHELAPDLLRDPAWPRIRNLCRSVQLPDGAHRGVVDNIWLEFDLTAGTGPDPTPALFFSTGPPASTTPGEYLDVVESVLATLDLGPLSPSLRSRVLRTMGGVPAGAGVFQFGLRLEDPVRAMRLCISGLAPDRLVSYLREIGWRYDPAPLHRTVDRLATLADDIFLDVDVGEKIGARIGLEAHLRGPKRPTLERRWVTLLNWLVAEGLCAEQARRDLSAWAGITFPTPDDVAGHNGLETLTHLVGDRASTCFLRGLNHVKLCYEPHKQLEVKAYIGFTRHWVTSSLSPVTPTGLSEPARHHTTARNAWRLLSGRQDATGGWGYNHDVPADADTTTWAVLLAESVGDMNSARLPSARAFRARHLRPDGGLATYTDDAPLRTYLSLPDTVSTAGWTTAHPCVSAAAAHLTGFGPGLEEYLWRVQRPDGSWPAYWWTEREYATSLALPALADRIRSGGGSAAAARRGFSWLRIRLEHHLAGGPDQRMAVAHGVAWCLAALACCDDAIDTVPLLSNGVDWLVQTQWSDGSWAASARLRVPPTDCLEPDEICGWEVVGRVQGSTSLDQGRVFTTASVLAALGRVQTRLIDPERSGPGR